MTTAWTAAHIAALEGQPLPVPGLIGEDDARRIPARRELAARLGIGLNALRNRALRLRETLEQCIRQRLGESGATTLRDGTPQKDTSGHE